MSDNDKDKSTKIEPRLLKGFRDYGPLEQLTRQEVFAKIQSVFERFGFLPLSTPILEYKDILMGKYGDDEKLVYTFKDKGDRDVAIRYDLTVPMARYVAQNQGQLVLPFKRYQIAPVLRGDNPQKGRLREFYQCDVDAVGTSSPLADAEVIACLAQALEAIGVTKYLVRINSREIFQGLSPEAIRSLDKVDKIGIDGVVSEMQEKGVPTSEIDQAKKLMDGNNRAPESVQVIMDLLAKFKLQGDVQFDGSIARGLDYYTSTVFEIVLQDKPEYGSIVGGGRYDGLVDQFSNQPVAAVGGSIGIDRLLQAMTEMGSMPITQPIKALVLNQNAALENDYLQLANDLRAAGINTELYYEAAKLDKQFKYAESKNIPYAIIMGETELKDGTVQLKNLAKREQETLAVAEVIEQLK